MTNFHFLFETHTSKKAVVVHLLPRTPSLNTLNATVQQHLQQLQHHPSRLQWGGFQPFLHLAVWKIFFSLERNNSDSGAKRLQKWLNVGIQLSQVVNVVTESRLKLLPLLLLLLPVLNNHEKKARLTFQPPRFRPIAPIVGASLSCTHQPTHPLKKKGTKMDKIPPITTSVSPSRPFSCCSNKCIYIVVTDFQNSLTCILMQQRSKMNFNTHLKIVRQFLDRKYWIF